MLLLAAATAVGPHEAAPKDDRVTPSTLIRALVGFVSRPGGAGRGGGGAARGCAAVAGGAGPAAMSGSVAGGPVPVADVGTERGWCRPAAHRGGNTAFLRSLWLSGSMGGGLSGFSLRRSNSAD